MGKAYNIGLACFAAIGSFLFGYDSGVMTDVIASKHFQNYFDTTSTSSIIGAINSTFSGGAVFGALFGGVIMDKFGRKKTIGIGAFICTVGAVLQAAAYHLATMLVGRIIAGFAVGLLSMSVPVYQSECASPKNRGLIVGLAQQMIGVGFIVSTWVGYGSHHMPDTPSFQWRFPLAFQAFPSALLCLGMLWLPETPRHLIATDQSEFNEIKLTIDAEKAATAPGWMIMFKVPQWRKRLMLGTLVQLKLLTSVLGINVIGYYQTIMYESLGITGKTNLLVAGIYNCTGPLANLVSIILISDKIGRKGPLIYGIIAISIALVLESVVNSQKRQRHPPWPQYRWRCFLVLRHGYLFAVLWPCVGNWLVSTFWNQVSPLALRELGWRFYFLFVAFNIVVTLPTLIFAFRETKGLSLEEIDLLFGDRALGNLPADIEKDGGAVAVTNSHGERPKREL
ncbi:hypothetical protein FPOA_04278 [Fusarium poae]|uniref:Major facilitator superfamily (MFS) profile domain-containing protein n=2 Tax=Fusarium poae TaxID=36050 RepID=A0A1B8ATC7_FUSPO|nr:hypothetical protein FPOA_04278 [Fusarium poae]